MILTYCILLHEQPCRLGLSFFFFFMWNREDTAFHKLIAYTYWAKKLYGAFCVSEKYTKPC